MDKKKLITTIIEQLEKDLKSLAQAAQATYEAATHEESKPENEYDTRGLEASYLAGAQAKRVGEIKEVLSMFKLSEIKDFKPLDAIAAMALVEVEYQSKLSLVLVMPKGGGIALQFEGKPIQVITPNSVLGEALVGLRAGETAEVETGGKIREYKILSVS